MGKQMTEMLKGTLEGIVLAILSVRPAYGYEITARLREQGFSDIAEGTVYAAARQDRAEAASSTWRRSRPRRGRRARCIRSTLRDGNTSKSSGGRGASSRNGSNSSTKEANRHGNGWIEQVTGSLEQKRRYRQYKARTRQLPANYRTAVEALERYLMYFGPITRGRRPSCRCSRTLPICSSRARRTEPRSARSSGEDPVEFAETFLQNYSEGQWINKERERLTNAIDRAAGQDTGKEEGSA